MPKCTSVVNHSKIRLEERQRKVIFLNELRDEYEVSVIDGCLITAGPRCDNIVGKPGIISILVELKGRDIEHACEQLFTTFSHRNVRHLVYGKVGFVVICSKYPRFDSFVARAKQRCAKEFKAGFHVICDQRELVIERAAAINGPY